jgi:hypothetical protein
VILRLLVGGRLLAGALLLAAPQGVLERLSRHRAGVGERRAARLLGVRNILEGAVVATHDRRGWLLAGAAVDSTHALSMIALAAARPAHRRLATASALAAIATATAGFVAARDARGRCGGGGLMS